MREEILKITMTVDDEKIIGSTTDQVRGPRGCSAYEVAVLLGYVGNEESWLESLKVKGDQGRSAYRVAVDEGFVGTVNEWRDSLIGPRGPVYDDSDLREQIDLELASLTRIASEAADVATTKAGEAVDAKNIVVLRADEVDGHAVILYGLFDEIEDYRQEVYRRALESVEQAGIATTKAGEADISAGEAEQSAQAAAQSASEAEQTLLDKVSKSDIVQTKGQSSANIMSQKAVTDLFNNIIPWLGSEIPAEDAVFDFEKNRYIEKGVPVGLSDISEFIRLSSATKWQDGQIVEVADNIPRISGDGLLIEPQRTNYVSETDISKWWRRSGVTAVNNNGFTTFTADNTVTSGADLIVYGSNSTGDISLYYSNGPRAISYMVKDDADLMALTVLASWNSYPHICTVVDIVNSTARVGSTSPVLSKTEINGAYKKFMFKISPLIAGYDRFKFGNATNTNVNSVANYTGDGSAMYTLGYPQVEPTDGIATSFIPTSGTPATRSPDILNIPLLPTQTITGDWDEGVTYEVADGIATFTGHGYIRNITVEEL